MKRISTILVGLLVCGVICPVLPGDGGASGFRTALAPHAVLAQRRRGRKRAPRYKGGPVENGGTIEGVVLWKGPIPKVATTKVPVPAAQQSHCGGREVNLNLLLIDEKTRGVQYSVVSLEGITRGKPLPARDIDFTTGKKAKLDQIHCQYVPRVMVVRRGTTLAITSSDDVLHNVNSRIGLDQLFNLALPQKGVVIDDPARTNVGRKTGVVVLRCNAGHYWMNGSIHVVAHPYYAVTDKEGRFKLTEVPAGEYTLKIWHENITPRFGKDASGKITDVITGRPMVRTRKVTVEAAKTVRLELDLSADEKDGK